jgi:hypothetical protein
VGVLIIANLTNFDEGGKTGLEGAQKIFPFTNIMLKYSMEKVNISRYSYPKE